jgi:hypothetical protein
MESDQEKDTVMNLRHKHSMWRFISWQLATIGRWTMVIQ